VEAMSAPVSITGRVGVCPSTGGRVFRAVPEERLSHVGRATGALLRRYERPRPGELVPVVHVRELGGIPNPAHRTPTPEIHDDETQPAPVGGAR
jgi:hypothetical protein